MYVNPSSLAIDTNKSLKLFQMANAFKAVVAMSYSVYTRSFRPPQKKSLRVSFLSLMYGSRKVFN